MFVFFMSPNGTCSLSDCHTWRKRGVQVRYLTSYERMGIAEVTCKGGCSCNKSLLDGHIEQRWSVPDGKEFSVTQAKDCILRIDARAGKGGSKVKILSVTLSFREEG